VGVVIGLLGLSFGISLIYMGLKNVSFHDFWAGIFSGKTPTPRKG
jgi:hypothetical protein